MTALSIIIPVYNEEESIGALLAEIEATAQALPNHEVVVVDDGSNDDTVARLRALKARHKTLRVIQHHRNSGQSAAIRSGVSAAKGSWIATLDGDGQNDPADIPRLLDEMVTVQKADLLLLVAGYRKQRQDTASKRFSSRAANAIRSRLLGDATPDTGCGLKIFARATFLDLPRFDHMHRFLPALFLREGGRVISIEVNHRPRERGVSKYGVHNRLWVGIVDILGVRWLQRRKAHAKSSELN